MGQNNYKDFFELEYLTINDGLAQSSINSIVQDKTGFIWMGTESGLCRYDGYEFKVFESHISDSTTIPNSFVTFLLNDTDSTIWVGTERGLSVFNVNTNKAKRVTFTSSKVKEHELNFINHIKKINEDIILISTRGGLVKYNKKTGVYKIYFINLNFNEFNANKISAVEKVTKNIYFLATDKGIYIYDYKNEKIFRFTAYYFVGNEKKINSIINDKNYVWFATDAGLIKYSLTTKKVTKLRSNKFYSKKIINVLIDKNGNLWVFSFGGGIKIIDNKTGKIIGLEEICEISDPNVKLSKYMKSFLIDNSGIIWLGSKGEGAYKLIRRKQFNYFLAKDSKSNFRNARKILNNDRIFNIYEDSDYNLWFATYGGGINFYNPKTGKVKYYIHDNKTNTGISGNDITNIIEAPYDKNLMWFGTRYYGISILNKKTGEIKILNSANSGLSNNSIFELCPDNKGNVWISTENGLNKYKPETNSFEVFFSNPKDSTSLRDNHARALLWDNGKLWVGTWGSGINLFNPETGKIEKIDSSNERCILNGYHIIQLLRDKNDLWVGTIESGLIKYDLLASKITTYNINKGLSNNTCYGILKDNKGDLWIPTNIGLNKFDPIKETFKTYFEEDGLINNEFNDGANMKDHLGNLYFGSFGGVVFFNPDEIFENKHKPNVIISKFENYNSTFNLEKDPNAYTMITLNYDQTVFSIRLSALNFINPNKNKYTYRVEGLTDRWINLGTKREIIITNLNPGEYIFHFTASNDEGIWSQSDKTLKIIVLPPFYSTWVFRILVIVVIVILIIIAYKNRIKSIKNQRVQLEKLVDQRTEELKQKNEELEDEIEERIRIEEEVATYIEELQESKDLMEKNAFDLVEINLKVEESEQKLRELNASKDKFFSIISHDLKSPFLALLGYTEILMEDFENLSKEEMQEFIYSVSKAAKNVYNLLENLLEWSRIQTGRIEYIPEFFNLYQVSGFVIDLLNENAKSKNIHLVDSVEKSIVVYANENMVNTIIRNLVSNAIKFTSEGGTIEVGAIEEDNFAKVWIKDNGIGMSAGDREKLFRIDVHHTTIGTNKEKGTGLGLILCKELVEKNGGEIKVISEINRGTTFEFTLPFSPPHEQNENQT